jgi:hypothetical protein
MATDTAQTRETIEHHLSALTKGLDEVLKDYNDETMIYTPEGTFQGMANVRTFFEGFTGGLPEGFMEAFEVLRMDVEGEVGYLLWSATPYAPIGTDTFIVRDGKIAVQTFAAHMAS